MVGTLTVTDPDNDSHTFEVSDRGTDNRFEVEGNTLKLVDGFAANFEDVYYFFGYRIRVTAIDSAGARITERFTITINDVDESAALSAVLEQAGVDGSTDALV